MSFSKFDGMISDAAHFIHDRLPRSRRNDPEWLKSLQQGDSPLLGPSEWEYIAEVRHRIIREAKPCPNIPSDRRLKHKLCLMKDNFEEVIKYLRENSDCKNYFVSNYPSWRSFRDQSITQLKNIAKAVNANRRESAVLRRDGSSMALIGGLMSFVPVLGVIRFAGGVLMGLGSLANIATSIVESEKIEKKIKEAEQIMLQDKEYTEKLWKWMHDVSQIEKAHKIIKDMKVVGVDVKNIASDLYGSFKESSIKSVSLEMIIRKVVSSMKISDGTISEIADVITMLIAIFMLFERYRPVFNVVFQTYKLKKMLGTVGNVIAASVRMRSLVNVRSKASGRIGIGMALDVLTIIQANMALESACEEAVEIEKITEELKKEAEDFKKVYDAVKQVSAG